MTKQEMITKKNLSKRLSLIIHVYLHGVPANKKSKMDKYLTAKVGNIVTYYFEVLKRKKRKTLVLKPLPKEI